MILHYIYDPLCGWCYGAKPLVEAAQPVLPVIAHAGGMMSGANRQRVSAQLRNYVMPHDRRIADYTGQPFGEAYFESLLRDHSAVFDSTPPIAAVMAAEAIDRGGLRLLGRLQSAHYVEGRRIADSAVLLELAMQMGYAQEDFHIALESVDSEGHIKVSRQFLAQLGGQGFPTMALEQNGNFRLVDISPWLGKPQAFADWLKQAIVLDGPGNASTLCAVDGCV